MAYRTPKQPTKPQSSTLPQLSNIDPSLILPGLQHSYSLQSRTSHEKFQSYKIIAFPQPSNPYVSKQSSGQAQPLDPSQSVTQQQSIQSFTPTQQSIHYSNNPSQHSTNDVIIPPSSTQQVTSMQQPPFSQPSASLITPIQSHDHSSLPLQNRITNPSDLKTFGINLIFQYIKALEAENRFWRDHNAGVAARVEKLAAYGEACERKNDAVVEAFVENEERK